MNIKHNLLYLSIASALSITPVPTLAATFCGDRTEVWFMGEDVTGEMHKEDCYEMWANPDVPGEAATAHDMDLYEGSKLSVLGYFKDSTVHSGAEVWIGKTTQIYSDGYIATVPALGSNITIENGGLIRVLDGGTLENSFLNGGMVYISNTGKVNDPGKSINNTVNNGGKLYVYQGGKSEGSVINQGGIEYVSTKGESVGATINSGAQIIYDMGIAKDVTINGGYSWAQANGKVLGQTNINNDGKLYLDAAYGTTGAYAESVNLNDKNSSLVVKGGFNDTDHVQVDNLSGNGQIWFQTSKDQYTGETIFSNLNVKDLSGNQHFHFNTSIADGRGDYLTIQNGTGQHKVSVADSGAEITNPLDTNLDLITDVSKGAEFELANISGLNINAVDGGTYIYELKNREDANGQIWYLTSKLDENGNEITTPGVDAILSLGSAAIFAFNNELDNLRFRKGTLKDNEGAAGLWMRVTGTKNNVSTGDTNFDLEQIGTEFGIDKQVAVNNDGVAFIGGFASYGKADVKHDRGGTSNIDSYSVGVYGTYFHDSGLYLDGTLKYNRFSNDLSARSTNGQAITGDYNQNAWGGAIESGFNARFKHDTWVEPFVRLSYVQAQAKSLNLNNGMQANIGTQKSLASELGVHLGKDFTLSNNSTLSPYIKATWSHEFMDNNNVWVNDINKFETNFSGDVAKFGLGLNVQINKTFSAFSEMNYAKGSKVETPMHANIGIRYNF